MSKKSLELSKVNRLLQSGPVVMITTRDGERANIITTSWHTMLDFDPPLIGCVVGDHSYSFGILKKTKECVINIPTIAIGSKAVGCGSVSGRKVDKFKTFGLTPVKASRVKAPLIGECYANLECRVIDQRMASRYNLFIVKVLKAWIDPSVKNPQTLHHLGGRDFSVRGKAVRIS